MALTEDPAAGPESSDSSGGPRRPEVGSVAEEAARLVELLSGRTGSRGPGESAPSGAGPGESGAPSPAVGTCTCGGTTPQACRLCPICQLISFVSSISPETIDRAADLVGLAATALRDLAAVQRAKQPADAAHPQDAEDPA